MLAHSVPRLSLAEALLVAARQSAPPPPSMNPPWLPALAESSPWPRPDSGWGVPAPWLRSLEAPLRDGVPLGTFAVQHANIGLRVNGRLRLGVTSVPMLGGRISLQLARYHFDFTLPGVRVIPHRENNQSYMEIGVVLFDRRF